MQDIRGLIRVELAGVLQGDNKAGVPFGLAWAFDQMKDLGQSSPRDIAVTLSQMADCQSVFRICLRRWTRYP